MHFSWSGGHWVFSHTTGDISQEKKHLLNLTVCVCIEYHNDSTALNSNQTTWNTRDVITLRRLTHIHDCGFSDRSVKHTVCCGCHLPAHACVFMNTTGATCPSNTLTASWKQRYRPELWHTAWFLANPTRRKKKNTQVWLSAVGCLMIHHWLHSLQWFNCWFIQLNWIRSWNINSTICWHTHLL